MTDRHVGTCGNCGGRVMIPSIWHGVVPPEPTCESCGSTAAPPEMPVMRMRPKQPMRLGDFVISDGRVFPIGEKLR